MKFSKSTLLAFLLTQCISSLALADNSGLGETSSTQTRRKITIRVDAKKGTLRMRTGQLEGRIATEKGTELGDKDGKRISLILAAPAMLINKDPGAIRAGSDKNDSDFYQESSGVLLNPGAEIMARVSKEGFLKGPKRYVVDAQGMALYSYQVIAYQSTLVDEAQKAREKLEKKYKSAYEDNREAFDRYRCEKLEQDRKDAIRAKYTQDEIAALSERDSEKLRALWKNKEFVAQTDIEKLIEENQAKLAEMLKDKEFESITCHNLDGQWNSAGQIGYDVQKRDFDAILKYFKLTGRNELVELLTSYVAAQEREKSLRGDKSSQPNDLKPYLTFDIRVVQMGGVAQENELMGQIKRAGTVSAVELSFEAAVLFNDVLNVTFQLGGDPARVEIGKFNYMTDERHVMGRTEAFAGIKFGGKYVQLSDRFSIGYDWARASSLKNEMSLEVMKRGRLGWQVEHERSFNAAPITTHMFFVDAIAF